MSGIASKIAALGENPNFVAFNAHWGFAFFVLTLAHHSLLVAGAAVVLAAFKEFYFDIRYETSPPQTYADGALDFAGYLTGIILGVFL